MKAIAKTILKPIRDLDNKGQIGGLATGMLGAGFAMIVLVIVILVVNNVEAEAGSTIPFKDIIYLVLAVAVLLGGLGLAFAGFTARASR